MAVWVKIYPRGVTNRGYPIKTCFTNGAKGDFMKILIGNAFSLSMLDRLSQSAVGNSVYSGPRIPRPIKDPRVFLEAWEMEKVEIESVVGHADTAALFSTILGRPIAVNRSNIKLTPDVRMLVGQYVGPRLPEGTTTLPDGATIEWWVV